MLPILSIGQVSDYSVSQSIIKGGTMSLGAGIALGEKVWSNNRWGEVIGLIDRTIVVRFERGSHHLIKQEDRGTKRCSIELQNEIELFTAAVTLSSERSSLR